MKYNFLSRIIEYIFLVKYLKYSYAGNTIFAKRIKLVHFTIYTTFLSRFANGVNEFLHHSRAYIPVKVAALLNTNPSLIASAVTAYCERDLIDKKICKSMKHFPPERLVLRSVKFTRFLYAMISHEKIDKLTNWTLPSPAESDFKEQVLGFKIVSLSVIT